MPSSRNPTRQRLIRAAITLFAAQGVSDATTKQIAEMAGVNEVTLFRQFGNKHGLLLAVMEEAAVFKQLGHILAEPIHSTQDLAQAVQDYATAFLQALDQVPEVVRSVIGEAGQFPVENRLALGRGFAQANRAVAESFQDVMGRDPLQTPLTAETLASLLNGLLLGYAVMELTSEFHALWPNRQAFLAHLATLFLGSSAALSQPSTQARSVEPTVADPTLETVADLSSGVVHQILRQAQKQGPQDYALVYVLFGAGLTSGEIVRLERSHYVHDAHHQVLHLRDRRVPINQWILGRRYGSYTRNPLTQWLKSRKDDQAALFLNAGGDPLSEADLRQQWRDWTADCATPAGQPLAIAQTQQTWCVEMLGRGMTVDELSILTGWDGSRLQPYAIRAKEKAVLEQALRLDRKAQLVGE
ncbi:MAG: TetR/AcrR family transcriptional regulator [Thermosynechococcaceae cyanobacterium]